MMENKILGKGNTAEVIKCGIRKVCKLECEENMKEEMKGVSIGEIYLKNVGVEIEDIKEYVESSLT